MAEPANRRDKPGGGKYYWHPVREKNYDSVTTVLDTVDKAALKIWAGQLSAAAAFDRLPEMTAATLVTPCGQTKADLRCGRCEVCVYKSLANQHWYESKRRAQEGTELHEAVQFWVTHKTRPSVRAEVQPFWDQFEQFVKDYGLTPGSWEQIEGTVINHDHGYAGTSDGAVRLDYDATPKAQEMCRRIGRRNPLIRVDVKTRGKPDERIYNDMPLQFAAYDRAPFLMLPDGTELPAPRTDACAVLQLRPGSYTFRLLVTDDETFEAFLNTLGVYRWLSGAAKRAISVDAFPVGPPLAAEFPDPWADDPAGVDFAAVQEAVEGSVGDPCNSHMSAEDYFGINPPEDHAARLPATPESETEAAVAVVEDVFGGVEVVDVDLPPWELGEPTPPPPAPPARAHAPGPDIPGSFGPGDRDPWAAHNSAGQKYMDTLIAEAKSGRPLSRTPPPAKKSAPAKKAAAPRKAAASKAPEKTDAELAAFKPGKPVTSAYDDEIPF